MALQGTDLLVVQHAGVVYKLEVDQLSAYALGKLSPTDLPIASATELGGIKVGDNLTIDPNTGKLDAILPAAIDFQGSINPANAAPAANPGDAYIVDTAGTFSSTFDNLSGQQGDVGDVCIYEGHAGNEWDLIKGLFGVGVITVRGQDPIEVDSSDANNPVVKIKAASPSTAGVGGQDGSFSATDKEKLDGISAAAEIGTVTEVKSNTNALTVTDPTNVPILEIRSATTTQDGITQLAVQADVDTAAADKAVPAQLFKVHEDRIDALETFAGAGSVTEVTGVSPINVADGTEKPIVSIDDSSTAQKGVVTLADATALSAGASDKVVTADQLKVANDKIEALENEDAINVVGDTNAISVGSTSAGGVTTFKVEARTSSDAAQGVVQLATTGEVEAGTDNSKATTSLGIATHYLIKDFSKLQPLI